MANNFLWIIVLMLGLIGCNKNHTRSTIYFYKVPQQLNDGLMVDNIATVDIDSTGIVTLTTLILADTFPNLHSLLIARNNKLVYENYFSGDDENWGEKLGYARHALNTLHDVRSISKSVVSACIGVALLQRTIKNIDDPIFNYLPDYNKYKTESNSKISIRDLLTMSSGIAWDEDVPHNTSKNDESQMEKSAEPVAYTLSLPLDQEPGNHWKYNSGGVQVLAAIIKSVSGEDVDKFAKRNLFDPLDITEYQWIKSQINFPAAASGLRLRSRDLIKIGLLYTHNGKWGNHQIFSEEWAKESLSTSILCSGNSKSKGYGYLFWTQTDTVNQKAFHLSAAKGNGGQCIFIDREQNLVVVITAGNYNLSDIRMNADVALEKYILPALR
jgi:CubicO group peptidase (beta-lactamase class C family)